MNEFNVFVYGTLMSDEGRSGALADQTFIRAARTSPEFTLFDLGPFPALAFGGEQQVLGELYGVNESGLARMDMIEGHPNFYKRQFITLEDGTEVYAYLLDRDFLLNRGATVIESASWRNS